MRYPEKSGAVQGTVFRRITGFTLTEMAIVLAIVGGIVATVWAVAGDVNMNKHVTVANKQLTAIVGSVRTLYAEQGGISNGGDATPATLTRSLDQLRAFPVEMRQNQSSPVGILFHEWNLTKQGIMGNVAVTAAACGGANGLPASASSIESCFGVYFYNLTPRACAQFLTAGNTVGIGLQALLVNGTSSVFPVDIGTANTLCSLAGTNSIEWVYLLKDNGAP